MPSPFRPSAEVIADVLHASTSLNYREVGATSDFAAPLPAALGERYDLDTRRFQLGRGRACFERAARAVFAWRHFEVPWVQLHGAQTPAAPGQQVASLVRVAGLWFLNPCRVITVSPVGPSADVAGFNYGTLPGHAESGEERFVVRIDPQSQQVEYEIAAFSRPIALLPRLAYPLARRTQRRFACATATAVQRVLAAD